jgi:DNA topoisomerase IB
MRVSNSPETKLLPRFVEGIHIGAVALPAVVSELPCLNSAVHFRTSGHLLVFRSGSKWHNVTAENINKYLHDISGGEFTAKDFRTWHATVLAAVGLAVSQAAAESRTARKRAIVRVVQEVADYLGNTPAVARGSYIDPRVIARYEEGATIASSLADLGKGQEFGDVATKGHAERAVLALVTSRSSTAS